MPRNRFVLGTCPRDRFGIKPCFSLLATFVDVLECTMCFVRRFSLALDALPAGRLVRPRSFEVSRSLITNGCSVVYRRPALDLQGGHSEAVSGAASFLLFGSVWPSCLPARTHDRKDSYAGEHPVDSLSAFPPFFPLSFFSFISLGAPPTKIPVRLCASCSSSIYMHRCAGLRDSVGGCLLCHFFRYFRGWGPCYPCRALCSAGGSNFRGAARRLLARSAFLPSSMSLR